MHCFMGVSRASTVVLNFLVARQRMPLRAAFELLRGVRGCAHPNPGFMRLLRARERALGSAASVPEHALLMHHESGKADESRAGGGCRGGGGVAGGEESLLRAVGARALASRRHMELIWLRAEGVAEEVGRASLAPLWDPLRLRPASPCPLRRRSQRRPPPRTNRHIPRAARFPLARLAASSSHDPRCDMWHGPAVSPAAAPRSLHHPRTR